MHYIASKGYCTPHAKPNGVKAVGAAVKMQLSICNRDGLNRMVSSEIAKTKELTNYACDSLGILALETGGNKSVDYEYNELKAYVWSIMTRFFLECSILQHRCGRGFGI